MSLLETRKHRRARLREAPPDPAHVAIVERRVPYFQKLSPADRKELLAHMNVFLDEKQFEGCAGLEITDEIRVTIAAQACLLLLHRGDDYFPKCDVILVYPHTYHAKTVARLGGGMVVEREQGRLGESHTQGAVVLSWDAVKSGASSARDGHNVVLHEFAHQLDQEDGAADGAPVLDSRGAYDSWAKTLGAEFEELKRDVDEGIRTDIDAYGATDPAEFFAVVTEEFFEKPEALVARHPALYDQLARFYKQDPLERIGVARPAAHAARPAAHAAHAAPTARAGKRAAKKPVVITLSDLSNDSRAASLVGTHGIGRDAAHALGCKRVGYVGTLFDYGDKQWGWIGEVMTGPDPRSVAVVFGTRSTSFGIALWTLLENGTVIGTERSLIAPRFALFHARSAPHPRGEHMFVQWARGAPEALAALHAERVDAIAAREKTTPVAVDASNALRTFLAARLRSTDLRAAHLALHVRARKWIEPPLYFVLAAILTFLMIHRATGSLERRIIVAFPICAALALVVITTIGPRLTWLLMRRVAVAAPVPAKELLARAAEIDDRDADRVISTVRELTPAREASKAS